ncbi:MAG: UbiX family flavin prenyltransferase [Chloroflexi bacterium]|jgi:4-hydroxy-3-polyprenylbenzoate decarboxylase|nr:UbiX family flavin prenyltransferase [Chloroflexota bacterium]
MTENKRIILAITGASGAIYGLRALEVLNTLDVEVHLVISPLGARVIQEETETTAEEAARLAARSYRPDDLAVPIASGSFYVDGMLIAPCSIKTLSAVANSYADSLISRAADVCLKEGRPLLLAVRETPLHSGHLDLMSRATQAGAIIFPPVPAFYSQPKTVDELVNITVGRMLARLGIDNKAYTPWQGGRH